MSVVKSAAAAETGRQRRGGNVDAVAQPLSVGLLGRSASGGRDRIRRPGAAAAAPQGEQPRAASHARPQLGAGRSARGDALRARPVRPKAVQDRHAAAGQELHPDVEPVDGGDEAAPATRVSPAPRRGRRRGVASRRRTDPGGTGSADRASVVLHADPESVVGTRRHGGCRHHGGRSDAARGLGGCCAVAADRLPSARSPVAFADCRLSVRPVSPRRLSRHLRRVASPARSVAASAAETAVRQSTSHIGHPPFGDTVTIACVYIRRISGFFSSQRKQLTQQNTLNFIN